VQTILREVGDAGAHAHVLYAEKEPTYEIGLEEFRQNAVDCGRGARFGTRTYSLLLEKYIRHTDIRRYMELEDSPFDRLEIAPGVNPRNGEPEYNAGSRINAASLGAFVGGLRADMASHAGQSAPELYGTGVSENIIAFWGYVAAQAAPSA
jgi:hypothetical protein